MLTQPFHLERYFADYEFKAKYLLSSSDIESLSLREVIAMADDETNYLWDNLKLSYTDSQGLPQLRQEISHLYRHIDDSDVLVVTPEEGIFLAMNALLSPGDHIIVTFPGYQSLYEIAKSIGCEITYWQGDENNAWRFDPEFVAQHLQKNTKLIACNFPHNPTGALLSQPAWSRLIEISREHHLYLFSDEMYRFLEFDEHARLESACDLYEQAISLCGMSKTFGMPGVRIGWLTTQDKTLYAKCAALKDYTTICSSAPSEILALIALRNRDDIIKKHRRLLENNLALLRQFLGQYSDLFTFSEPKAGSICFPRLNLSEGAVSFCKRVVEETGIMLLPSTVYEYDDNHLRIGFGRSNFGEALQKLADYLNNSP